MLIALYVILIALFVRVCFYYLSLLLCIADSDIWMTYDQFVALYSIDPRNFCNYHFKDYGPCVRYSGTETYYYIYFKSVFDWWKAEYLIFKNEKSNGNSIRIKYTLKFINELKSKIEEKAG